MPTPRRGEVWFVDLGLAARVRPCLVIGVSPRMEDRALATVIAHTTSPRASHFEVRSKVRFLRPGVFDAQNVVTIPLVKLIRRLGHLPDDELSNVEAALCNWLGLSSGGNPRREG